MLEQQRRNASVIAHTDTKLESMDAVTFQKFVKEDPRCVPSLCRLLTLCHSRMVCTNPSAGGIV